MRKDRLIMYKETYSNEIDRKQKLNSEITIPIAMITLQFSVITYAVGKMEISKSSMPLLILLIAIGTLVVSLISSTVYLIRSYYNYTYEYMATSKQIEDYYCVLTDEYKDFGDSEYISEKYFEEYLINDYCKCNDRNIAINDERSNFLHKAKTAIIIGLIASALIVGASNYDRVFKTTKDCFIKVTTGKEVIRNGPNIESTGAESPATTTATATTN